jgi:PleD family two-component response regulator
MKRNFLLLMCVFDFFIGYCQNDKSSLAHNIEAITSLAWPLITLLVVILLFPYVKKMLVKGNLSIKVGNMELSIQQAATQLTKNVLDLEKKMMDLKCELDEATNKKTTISPAAKKKEWSVLWVTENHKSHAFEIAYLERDGVDVIKATSTKEAIEILKEEAGSIDAIITGMNRKENNVENPKAGLELVKKVKKLGYPIEVFVMCSPENVKQYYDQLKSAGAKNATSSPLELFSFLKGAGLNCPLQQKELAKVKTQTTTV